MKQVNTKALKRDLVGVRKVAERTRTPDAERCAYCRGLLQQGEARKILDGEKTVYVHRRHPKRAGEQA
jgi:hypothetical protein